MTSRGKPTTGKQQQSSRMPSGGITSFFKRKRSDGEDSPNVELAKLTPTTCNDTDIKVALISETAPDSPAVKRRKTSESVTLTAPAIAKQRVTGANPAWEKEFLWLNIAEDGMYCKWCTTYNRNNSANGGVWVNKPCVHIWKPSCTDHRDSELHKAAVIMMATQQS